MLCCVLSIVPGPVGADRLVTIDLLAVNNSTGTGPLRQTRTGTAPAVTAPKGRRA